MERNLLYNEIKNLDFSFDKESKDYFWGSLIEAYLEQKYSQASIYGGYKLKIGDNDDKGIYGGTKSLPKATHIKNLQQDLIEFGITIRSKKPNGIFDFETELAVREFQIYTKMGFVAQAPIGADRYYGESFFQTKNNARYNGNITGEVDEYVRRRILFWKANNYFCPVIVRAWNIDRHGMKSTIYADNDNIWRYNQVTSKKPRMYVSDFSGHYSIPINKNANDIVIGDGAAGGPEVRDTNHSWDETEFTTEDIFNGLSYNQLTTAQQATFKIVRAIANAEANGGFLDRINSWDDQYISFGPYHWTLQVGELPSFLALFKEKFPNEFEKAVGFFGIDLNLAWNGNGQALLPLNSQRKFSNGRFKINRGNSNVILNDLASPHWGNYFRNWHFFYRFVMTARTIPQFRWATYDFAKMRMKAVLSIPIKNFGFVDAANNAVNPTIGEIFSSEKSFAMVLRIHVFRPAWITNINNSGNTLRAILQSAMRKINNNKFSTWTATEERVLIDELLNYNSYPSRVSDVHNTLTGVDNFNYKNLANGIGKLSEQRNFSFDSSQVPIINY